MAFLLNTFGSKVVLATEAPRILPREDHDTSQRLAQSLREKGVEVLPRHALKGISAAEGGSGWACLLAGAKERTVTVAKVLMGARKPATANLGIEQLGVRLNDDGGIKVNQRLETSVDGIYSIGDATGGWMLSHAASSMAVTAAENCMGKSNVYPFQLIPRGLWTFPEMGAVGFPRRRPRRRAWRSKSGAFLTRSMGWRCFAVKWKGR